MRVARSALRKGLCALILGSVGVGAAGMLRAPTSATDADVYAFDVGNSPGPLSATVPTSAAYTFVAGAACTNQPLPSPVATAVPGFLDVPQDEGGPCTSVSGNGTLTVAHCDTGLITANWTFTEPFGDTVAFTGTGVIVGGIAVIGAPPAAGYGYFDPVSTSTPGAAAAVAVFTSYDVTDGICGKGSSVMNRVVAVVAAAYSP